MNEIPDDNKGSAGGKARRDALSSEQRKEIAASAAKARWEKIKQAKEIKALQAQAPLPDVLKTKRSGEVRIGSWFVPCFVLENDLRVISQRALMEIMEIRGRSGKAGDRLLGFLHHPALEALQTFKEIKLAISEPVRFIIPTGFTAYGYSGETVVDYCRAILQARKTGFIGGETFNRCAAVAEALVASVAKVGIIALIDEATGHQDVRARDDLQKHLERFLKKEFAAWAKRFPDEFYIEMFRLRGWQWQGMKINRPQCVGGYTNDIVYSRLTPGLLEELQRLNPSNEIGLRHHRHHQHLTADVGHPELQMHLYAVLGFMRASNTWASFIHLLDKSFPRIGDTFALKLDDDEINPSPPRAYLDGPQDQPF